MQFEELLDEYVCHQILYQNIQFFLLEFYLKLKDRPNLDRDDETIKKQILMFEIKKSITNKADYIFIVHGITYG